MVVFWCKVRFILFQRVEARGTNPLLLVHKIRVFLAQRNRGVFWTVILGHALLGPRRGFATACRPEKPGLPGLEKARIHVGRPYEGPKCWH